MTCRINSISRGSSFFLQILLSNYKANNHKANNYKANRPLLVQMLIRGSVERRHFPHSGNSTDCGRPMISVNDHGVMRMVVVRMLVVMMVVVVVVVVVVVRITSVRLY